MAAPANDSAPRRIRSGAGLIGCWLFIGFLIQEIGWQNSGLLWEKSRAGGWWNGRGCACDSETAAGPLGSELKPKGKAKLVHVHNPKQLLWIFVASAHLKR
jgi:hypothetical protein